MISEFHELSQKIDRLAEMAASLRRENAQLRQRNVVLSDENAAYAARLAMAQSRVEALLDKIPAEEFTAIPLADEDPAQ